MKIQLLSDLHREFSKYEFIDVGADVVVLAGDISKGTFGLEWAKTISKPVVYVAGNHEYYGQVYSRVLEALRHNAKGTNVHFLENDEVFIDGVRFLGTTLWTDFELFGREGMEATAKLVEGRLNDYAVIHKQDSKTLTWRDTLEFHMRARAFLEDHLSDGTKEPTVVVTHHMPHPACVHPKWANDRLTAGFASDLGYLMGKAKLWLYGHTHDSGDHTVNGTRLVGNPRGYSRWEQQHPENPAFRHNLVLEV